MKMGLVTITYESTKNRYNIPWKDTNFSHEEINTVILVHYVYKGIEIHYQYVRHLYLDCNQMRGEMKPGKEEDWLVTMEYMMNLQAKMHQSAYSKFHGLMTKGCSVHVFCIKRRMKKYEAHAMLADKGAVQGDHQMVWIDSFPSNTGQGGYETLCAIEANLTLLEKLFSTMNNIVLCSNAGSGYKTTQCILGMSNLFDKYSI